MTNRTRTRAVAVAGALAGVVLTIVAWFEIRAHGARHESEFAWTWSEWVYWPAAIVGSIAMAIAGWWLVRQLHGRLIGWWVLVSGIAFPIWLIAINAEYAWLVPARWTMTVVFRLALVVAVLTWPTGRLEPRFRRPVWIAIATYGALSLFGNFIWFHSHWGSGVAYSTAVFGPAWFWLLVSSLLGTVLTTLGAAALLVFAVRRWRRLPPVLSAAWRPALWAAIVLGVGDLLIFASNSLAREIEWSNIRLLGTVSTLIDFGHYGVVAVLLVVADFRQRRLPVGSTRVMAVDGSPTELLGQRLGRLVGDPTARFLFPSADERWIDGEGTRRTLGAAGRSTILIAAPSGATIAALDMNGSLDRSPNAIEGCIAALQLEVVAASRVADARAALDEVRALQRSVISVHDAARRRLERELHDGAQQQLVAMTLEVSLARRDGMTDDARLVLAERLRGLAESLRVSVGQGVHAALNSGLAAGLAVLRDSVPIPCSLTITGDLDGADPVAQATWFACSEAVTNALKHADAAQIAIQMSARTDAVLLTVTDDGIGGVMHVPDAINRRIVAVGGETSVRSVSGAGTTIEIHVPLHMSEGPR